MYLLKLQLLEVYQLCHLPKTELVIDHLLQFSEMANLKEIPKEDNLLSQSSLLTIRFLSSAPQNMVTNFQLVFTKHSQNIVILVRVLGRNGVFAEQLRVTRVFQIV